MNHDSNEDSLLQESSLSKESERSVPSPHMAEPLANVTTHGGHSGRLKSLTWGIFTIVYETCTPVRWSISSFIKTAQNIRQDSRAVARLFWVVFHLAPVTLLLHLFATVWSAFLPSLALYSYSLLFRIITTGIVRGDPQIWNVKLILLVFVMSSVIRVAVDWLLRDTTALLRSHLRGHFLPSLVTASLSLDLQTLQDPRIASYFPKEYLFEDAAPGWEAIGEGCRLIGIGITFLSHVIVVLSILPKEDELTPGTCSLWFTAYLALQYLRPLDGAAKRPFIFYSDNPIYERLSILYRTAFSPDMRESLASDGGAPFLAREFRKASQALGPGRNDPSQLRYTIPKPWYWAISQQILMELPLVSFLCLELWKFTPASLISIFLVWQGQNSLRCNVHFADACASFRRASLSAVTLFEALNITHNRPITSSYPDAQLSTIEGAKISLRNASFAYPITSYYDACQEEARTVLHDITFDILPGTLTLVVGKNGSGKSTLLKLVSGLFRPQSGDVLIDTLSMSNLNESDLRRSVCHHPQEPRLYPMSLVENLLVGLDHAPERSSILRAAEQAGILDLVERLPNGFDTLMGSVATAYRGVAEAFVDGVSTSDVCPMLNQEYTRHFKVGPVLSQGEKQRLALARTILKLENEDVRLLLVDEPASALDPVAEMDYCTKLKAYSRGRTVIAVTHHFGQLARQADMILCIEDGRIAEKGKHDELMESVGVYQELYDAQRRSEC
ncbi:P-loop containing nucleoside triphosphate hydrolase protein [Heliocybe sulcata]|uniref:P-loop containing nucleoside triphosphate hydrolase protein n=1 Tax=Heliocybe sulcata TaxID=5364 RepID=A0A5C3MVE9_9AGAM|nr:P-loop containing nucleoside triphosphate hydrolase protein [Heliocybe sulcata]